MKTPQDKFRRAKRARKFDRSFQPSAAGKGHQSRVDDVDSYRRNWDLIDWSPKKTLDSGA